MERPTLRQGELDDARSTTSEDDTRIGRVLDERYRLLRRLGEGGMGLVYEAEHIFLKSRVAVKVLRADMADAESIARLKREAQSASAIGNPHIVDVRDFGQLPDGSTYVVMERIDGADLLKEIRRERMPWKRALHIGRQVAEALGAAHEQGIIHRDLKPENILLTEKNGDPDFVKIVDFGIARMQGAKKLTAAGRVVGTPEYMSPEQCAGLEVDQRADIYALGILLYEMITQQLPFHDDELIELLRQQLKKRPEPPREVAPEAGIPAELEVIVLRCLAKRPSQRYQTMEEVDDALRDLDPGEATPEEEPTDGSEVAHRHWDSTAPFPFEVPAEEAPDEEAPDEGAPDEDAPVAEARTTGDSETRPRRGLLIGIAVAAALAAGAATVLLVVPHGAIEASAAAAPAARDLLEEPGSVDTPAPDEQPDPPARTDATGTQITIDTTPSGAQVFEGETALGETPLPIPRPTGDERRVVTLRQRGYRNTEIALSTNSADQLHVTLERRRGHAPVTPVEVELPDPGESRRRRDQGHRTGFIDPWNR